MAEANYWTRRFGRRRLLRGTAGAGVGLAGAALIGCGTGDEEEPDGGDGGPASPAAGTPSSGDQVQRGGTLRFDIAVDPPNFDVHANSTYAVNNPLSPIFNLLVQFDPFQPSEPPDAVVADLAESWEIADDGLHVTFNLVQNAKFHNGQPFTAEDVKATFERIKSPPEGVVSPREAQFGAIESIDVPDDYTAVFNLSRPAPSLLPLIAQGWNVIYSADDINNGVDFKLNVNGTGPFRFKNYTRGNRLETERNQEYHVEGRPYLDAVTAFVIADNSTRLANFQSGELDLLRAPTTTDSKTLEGALGDQIVVDGPMPSYSFGSINFGQADPWRDVRVRRAFSMAMNREEANTLLNQGEGYVGGYFMPTGVWANTAEDIQATPGYQPVTDDILAEARSLLDAAGVPEGKEVSILTRQGQSYENLSLYIQDQLKRVGINATPDVQETASAYDRLNSRAFDLAPWVHGYALDDPDALFAEFYIGDAPRNYSEISGEAIEDLFSRQTVEMDFEARVELARELELVAIQEFGKIITTWTSAREIRWPRVKDRMKHNSLYNNWRFEDVWLDT